MERERRLLSCLRREGLGEPEELLELELRDVLELPERLDADEELEPLLEPVLVLEPELEVELDRDLGVRWKGSQTTTGGSSISSQHRQACTCSPEETAVLLFPSGTTCPHGETFTTSPSSQALGGERKWHSHHAVTGKEEQAASCQHRSIAY